MAMEKIVGRQTNVKAPSATRLGDVQEEPLKEGVKYGSIKGARASVSAKLALSGGPDARH
jgi:hypothetical protein